MTTDVSVELNLGLESSTRTCKTFERVLFYDDARKCYMRTISNRPRTALNNEWASGVLWRVLHVQELTSRDASVHQNPVTYLYNKGPNVRSLSVKVF